MAYKPDIDTRKLFVSLSNSTIWLEDSSTRIVWITMLAHADENGEVMASVPGLSRMAMVSINKTRAALDKLLAPYPDLPPEDDEGPRIKEINGGWRLLTPDFVPATLEGTQWNN